MRFMMMVKANKDTEAGAMPEEKLIAAMGKYNEELQKAGVLLDLSGLQPSSKGARIKFSGGKRTVVGGPFTDAKELIAGYWLIQVKSKEADAERIFHALAENGTVRMPLQQTFWAVRFGMVVDQFGIPWMVNCEQAA